MKPLRDELNEKDQVVQEMEGDYEIDFTPPPTQHLAINKKVRGRPKRSSPTMPFRTNSYRHSDNKIPKKTNRKPSREVEAMAHDNMPPLRHLPDGSGAFTGFHLPRVVIDRFDREGYKIGFFQYGPELREYVPIGWQPVMNSEVPEIAYSMIPIPGIFNESLREYFIYRGYMLMKITHAKWDVYAQDFNDKKANHERILKQSTSVRTGERRHGLVMEYGRS